MVWLIVMLVLMIPLTSILLDSQLGRALAGRIESRGLSGGDTVTQERIAYLESEVERLSKELDQVSEESRFVQKLLMERAEGDPERGAAPESLPRGGGDS